jgi:threonine/homoserine/homoserine lactone efflux protein
LVGRVEQTSMTDILPSGPSLAAFFAASLVLAATPGPGVLYIVTRSLAKGPRAGLASVAGVALGNFGNATGAAVGLGALLAISVTAFSVVKYAGALYLVYLGVRALSARRGEVRTDECVPTRSQVIFRDGFVVALLNPKTAVFFAAFLPQFMNTTVHPIPQSVTLGTLFVLIAMVTDTVYAVAAGAVAPLLWRVRGVRTLGRYLTGGTFIGLGVYTAFASPRSNK